MDMGRQPGTANIEPERLQNNPLRMAWTPQSGCMGTLLGAMDRLAVVTESLLREALRIAGFPCPFSPRVAVGMQSDAL